MPHDPAASDQGPAAGDKRCWLGTIRRYVLCAAFGHLIWEFAQMPLYTIAWQGELACSSMFYHFGRAAGSKSDAWFACCHCLQQHQPKRFAAGGKAK